MKYEIIIENNLKQTALKRVRIKVDPSLVCQTEDLSQCDGYEGYILAETGDVPKVLVMSPDGVSSVMDIPQQFLQMLMSDEESEALRAFKQYICDICELDTTTPEAELLLSAPTIEEVESILKTVGLTDDELKVLYRNFISDNTTVNESLFSNLLNKATAASKSIGAIAGKAATAAGRSLKSPAAWSKGIGGALNVLGADVLAKPFTAAGNALDKGYKAYKAENINQLVDAFASKNIKPSNFVSWLNSEPAALKTVQAKPTVQMNAATRRDLERNKNYYTDIKDVYDTFVNNKLDLNKFMADANTYLNSVAAAAVKPPEGDTVQLNGKTYIYGMPGQWTLPKKDDPTKPGAYVTDKNLQQQLTTAWQATKKTK